jgi:protein ImuB
MRFACLQIPDFPLAALLRVQPELRGAAVAVADGGGPRARLLAVSGAAVRQGVSAGLSAAQALAIESELIVRPLSVEMLQAAQSTLLDVAASFSPRVEDCGDGVVYLDLEGLVGTLFESEAQLATMLAQRAVSLGLDAQVGVAGSKIAAALAAHQGGGVAVIPAGEEWSFLAPVPIARLQPSSALTTTLQRWGIHTIGQLAALPVSAIGARLGPEGVQLIRRARGEDDVPLIPRALPLHFEEGMELDYGADNLEPFSFVLRGLLERLTARLSIRGLVCGDLRLSLRLSLRQRDERTVRVAAPSNDVKALLALVRLHLEAHPPAAAVEGVRVIAIPERLRAAQLDLFRPNGPAPAALAVTLARLTAICGSDRVGTPAVADSHRPDLYGVKPFEVVGLLGCYAVRPDPDALDHRATSAPNNLPPNNLTTGMRAFRPPRAIEVFCHRDRPEFVRGDGFAGRVVQAAGPWRVQGDWWNEGNYARDYYDVQLSDGGVYRVYCERGREWFVEGAYD